MLLVLAKRMGVPVSIGSKRFPVLRVDDTSLDQKRHKKLTSLATMGGACSRVWLDGAVPSSSVAVPKPGNIKPEKCRRINFEAGCSSAKYSGSVLKGSGISTMDGVETQRTVGLADEEGLMGSLHKGKNKSKVLVEDVLDRRESSAPPPPDDRDTANEESSGIWYDRFLSLSAADGWAEPACKRFVFRWCSGSTRGGDCQGLKPAPAGEAKQVLLVSAPWPWSLRGMAWRSTWRFWSDSLDCGPLQT